MQAEEKNQGTGDRSEEGAIPLEKCADGAGGGPEGDEDHGETGDEGERRGEKSGAGLLALAELLDSDAGEHGDVAGNEREHAGREKRNQASQESSEEGDIGHSRSVLACVETSFGIFTLPSSYVRSAFADSLLPQITSTTKLLRVQQNASWRTVCSALRGVQLSIVPQSCARACAWRSLMRGPAAERAPENGRHGRGPVFVPDYSNLADSTGQQRIGRLAVGWGSEMRTDEGFG